MSAVSEVEEEGDAELVKMEKYFVAHHQMWCRMMFVRGLSLTRLGERRELRPLGKGGVGR